MKILWLINFEIPMFGNDKLVNEGWISGMLLSMIKYYPENEMYIVYPQTTERKTEFRVINGINAIGYYRSQNDTIYDPKLNSTFQQIINQIYPDVIHIMGTEYPHSLSMCEACITLKVDKKLIVSVQGLIGPCSEAYCLAIPYYVRYGRRIKDILYGGINTEKKRLEKRAIYERKTLSITQNIIGRTDWDEMCTKRINKNAKYWHNNEVLRNSFYSALWNYSNCVPNTVFVSQGNYPIKGLHILIEGARILKNLGFELNYRIAGENIFSKPTWKLGKYAKYLYDILRKYELIRNFEFLGKLKEEQMVTEYLRANIFIMPSLIENSPNSLGEAMILGLPVISTDVGGVKNFIKHGNNGYMFPLSEPYMMAYYIIDYLNNPGKAVEMGYNARLTALDIYDRKKNSAELEKIYLSL